MPRVTSISRLKSTFTLVWCSFSSSAVESLSHSVVCYFSTKSDFKTIISGKRVWLWKKKKGRITQTVILDVPDGSDPLLVKQSVENTSLTLSEAKWRTRRLSVERGWLLHLEWLNLELRTSSRGRASRDRRERLCWLAWGKFLATKPLCWLVETYVFHQLTTERFVREELCDVDS